MEAAEVLQRLAMLACNTAGKDSKDHVKARLTPSQICNSAFEKLDVPFAVATLVGQDVSSSSSWRPPKRGAEKAAFLRYQKGSLSKDKQKRKAAEDYKKDSGIIGFLCDVAGLGVSSSNRHQVQSDQSSSPQKVHGTSWTPLSICRAAFTPVSSSACLVRRLLREYCSLLVYAACKVQQMFERWSQWRK